MSRFTMKPFNTTYRMRLADVVVSYGRLAVDDHRFAGLQADLAEIFYDLALAGGNAFNFGQLVRVVIAETAEHAKIKIKITVIHDQNPPICKPQLMARN